MQIPDDIESALKDFESQLKPDLITPEEQELCDISMGELEWLSLPHGIRKSFSIHVDIRTFNSLVFRKKNN